MGRVSVQVYYQKYQRESTESDKLERALPSVSVQVTLFKLILLLMYSPDCGPEAPDGIGQPEARLLRLRRAPRARGGVVLADAVHILGDLISTDTIE